MIHKCVCVCVRARVHSTQRIVPARGTGLRARWRHTSRRCGPCLQNRYGENIFEIGVAFEKDFVYPPQKNYLDPPPQSWNCMANAQNPGWVCPACRGICNCSTKGCLRDVWGWADTGALVGRATRKGYDSCAHYLVMGNFDTVLNSLELSVLERNVAAMRRHLRMAEYMLSEGGEVWAWLQLWCRGGGVGSGCGLPAMPALVKFSISRRQSRGCPPQNWIKSTIPGYISRPRGGGGGAAGPEP